MLRTSLSVVLVAVSFMISVTAQADISVPLLLNQSTGATIFDDNFDVGTDDAAPVATVGTWTLNSYASSGNTVVRSSDWGDGGLGPNQGAKQLALWAGDLQNAFTAAGLVANSGANQTIKMELAFRLISGNEISIIPLNGGTELFQIGIWGPDASTADPAYVNNAVTSVTTDGQNWIQTGLSQNPNAWNTLTLVHTNGTTDWSISVNGSTPYLTTGYATGSSSPWTGFRIETGLPNAVAYFDAASVVPEPSSLFLCASAVIGLLAYAWRKRK